MKLKNKLSLSLILEAYDQSYGLGSFYDYWNAERINALKGTEEEVLRFLHDYGRNVETPKVGDVTSYLGNWAHNVISRLEREQKIMVDEHERIWKKNLDNYIKMKTPSIVHDRL